MQARGHILRAQDQRVKTLLKLLQISTKNLRKLETCIHAIGLLGCRDRPPRTALLEEPEPMLRFLILTGDSGESQEIYYAKYRLEEEGWHVDIANLQKRVFQSVVHDFDPGFDTYVEKSGYRVEADLGFDQVNPASYEGLVLPGGRAPEFLRNRPKAVEIVRHFVQHNKPIAANCHGPLLLIAAGGSSGRTMTAYPELELDIRAGGATFVNAPVVTDGNLVTVRGWPDNGPWMREFVKLVKQRNGL